MPLPKHNLLQTERHGDTTVVTFTERTTLDEQSIRALYDELAGLAHEAGRGRLLLNFGNVEHLSSIVLSKLLRLHKQMLANGGQLVLCNVGPSLREIFRITCLDGIFTIQESTAECRTWRVEPAASSKLVYAARHDRDAEPPCIVLCDPDAARQRRLAAGLADGLTVVELEDLPALARYCTSHVVIALAMPLQWPGDQDWSEAAVLQFIRTHGRHSAILVYADTNRVPIEIYCRALAAGAKQVMNDQTPSFVAELRETLLRLVHNYVAEVEEQERLGSLFAEHGLIGQSLALREVFRRAVKASHFSNLPILLMGETGTGKQRLAEAIHRLDPRRCAKPFITLNCSAISKTLAESELFGHAKGAFSGAQQERLGVFRAANGGTLLMDEVGELEPELQPKLLRVLQENRLLPVGADYEHEVDVRIIAATNRPLAQMVAEKTFREDLYQRLNVFQIRIPPLRERPEDIETQARHFLKRCQQEAQRRILDFGPRVLEALRLLPWEGNTRQLENLVREALASKTDGALLQMEDLPRWVLEQLVQLSGQPADLAGAADPLEERVRQACERSLSLTEALQEYERQLLEAALEANAGNRTRTAAKLGLTPRSIFNKIKKHKLDMKDAPKE